MTDFLLELLSEEIPARMQARARADLERLFAAELATAGLAAGSIETYSTPRRLALIARGLPEQTAPVREERRGPRADAPDQAIAGFLGATGLTRDQLETRDDKKGALLYAILETPGRPTRDILAEAIPRIVRTFPWPKSMRWGDGNLRWVRPLHNILAIFGQDLVPIAIPGVATGAATVGHRFHHPGPITIGGADDYAEKLRACHVILDHDERATIIRDRAHALAEEAGLELVEDEGLVVENAALTEWPVPLLGSFDEAFLDVPPEVITLTMRTNQKYFALKSSPSLSRGGGPAKPVEGPPSQDGGVPPPPLHQPAAGPPPRAKLGEDHSLAPAFICTANIDPTDGGASIVAGNRKVLAARLADAKFFWEQDRKTPLEEHAKKLDQIVFHEKLGTVADKVERVAKLARWLVEEGIISPLPLAGGVGGGSTASDAVAPDAPTPNPSREREGDLAHLAETAARLCKADLVTQMVGEFPELQGVIGGYYAAAQGLDPRIAAAIRDHYKPAGQGDEVPTEPVTVAVALADKLDTLIQFFRVNERPTGSKDPFALRRAALGANNVVIASKLRVSLSNVVNEAFEYQIPSIFESADGSGVGDGAYGAASSDGDGFGDGLDPKGLILDFLADRLKVQQREAGVRHDLIDAVFALGGEDDLVRLLARVRALQAFVETGEGANFLAGYKRGANILKKEDWLAEQGENKTLSYTPEKAENDLIAALDSVETQAAAAVEAEDFGRAMAALATLRAPVDAFFDEVTVNDPDPEKRKARLDLLLRMRNAVHRVADFSKVEG